MGDRLTSGRALAIGLGVVLVLGVLALPDLALPPPPAARGGGGDGAGTDAFEAERFDGAIK